MRKYIPHILIGVLIIAGLLQWLDREGLAAEVATEKQKVKDRDVKLAEFDVQLAKLKIGQTKLQDSISGLQKQIAVGKSLIISIQKDRDEKLKIIERYTVSDMQQFFDKRYGTGK